jgi:glycosyl transferase, family 25
MGGMKRGDVLFPVKVISLDRSEARRTTFMQMNRGLRYEFVSAVDGSSLDAQVIADRTLFGEGLDYSAGARGCALSHRALWELASSEHRVLTIAEDDAVFRDDFGEKAPELIARLPPGWDIILWAWNFDSILSVQMLPGVSQSVMLCDQAGLRHSIQAFKNLQTPSVPLRLGKCFGTPAYSISPGGARKFRAMCFPLRAFTMEYPLLNRALPNTGIDSAMNKIYSLTDSFVCFPPLAATKNETEISTVQTGHVNAA